MKLKIYEGPECPEEVIRFRLAKTDRGTIAVVEVDAHGNDVVASTSVLLTPDGIRIMYNYQGALPKKGNKVAILL